LLSTYIPVCPLGAEQVIRWGKKQKKKELATIKQKAVIQSRFHPKALRNTRQLRYLSSFDSSAFPL